MATSSSRGKYTRPARDPAETMPVVPACREPARNAQVADPASTNAG